MSDNGIRFSFDRSTAYESNVPGEQTSSSGGNGWMWAFIIMIAFSAFVSWITGQR